MLSPMMRQYFEIKEQNKDCILLYRLGDFYEMFFEDAIIASKELELTLTGRDCGLEERAPMCGVPFHSVDGYIAKLVEKGHKVAICEQMEQPDGKGIFTRNITRRVTRGTVMADESLTGDRNNYIASVYYNESAVGIAYADITTGEMYHEFIDAPVSVRLNDILTRIAPSEIICNSEMMQECVELSCVKYGGVCGFSQYDDAEYEYDEALLKVRAQLNQDSVKSIETHRHTVSAMGALIAYLESTQCRKLSYLNNAADVSAQKTVYLNLSTRKTLELIESTGGGRTANLLWAINETTTKMGARLLTKHICEPSNDAALINARLDATEQLYKNTIVREKLKTVLGYVKDIERIATRVDYGDVKPSECYVLATSIAVLGDVKELLRQLDNPYIKALNERIEAFKELSKLLNSAISSDAPKFAREGGMIKAGFDEQLDEHRTMCDRVDKLILAMAMTERTATNIKNLKIGNNRVFGYYIEVPKAQAESVPYRYVRKQTTTTSERFVTPELINLQEQIVNSQSLAADRELALYEDIINKLRANVDKLLETSRAIAELDCVLSNAVTAKKFGYVKPQINESIKHIKIVDGRHPVVERLLGKENFVSNNTFIDDDENSIMLITGPNMAGKSLYMRQTALIALLAHIGSFVSARSAEICLLDSIYTRVGASDDLNTGRSTFMVEMTEIAEIMSGATHNSLVLLDEIGRGTSTYDGLSIAWAIIERLAQPDGPKVLFSTHFHELTELEGVLHGLKNYKLTAKELNGTIIFLRKLVRGSANKSFGIEVAALAGVPSEVLTRAREVLNRLESADVARQAQTSGMQLSMFAASPRSKEAIKIIKELNIDDISPKAAFDILVDLKEKVENE